MSISRNSVNRNSQIDFFCIFLGVTFLRLVFFSQYLKTLVKKAFFVFSLNFNVSLIHFCSEFFGFPSKIREKKRNIKNTQLDPKTMRGFLKIFLVAVNFSGNFTNEDNFVGFSVKLVAKSTLNEKKQIFVSISFKCVCGSEDCSTIKSPFFGLLLTS